MIPLFVGNALTTRNRANFRATQNKIFKLFFCQAHSQTSANIKPAILFVLGQHLSSRAIHFSQGALHLLEAKFLLIKQMQELHFDLSSQTKDF